MIIDSPGFSVQFQMAFEKWNAFVAAEKAKQKVMSTFNGKKIKGKKEK
jgi:hypothetical protein